MEQPILVTPYLAGSARDEPQVGQAIPHESAVLHVTGKAVFVDDQSERHGTLYAAPICSTIAKGRILSADFSACEAVTGVVKVLTARNLTGGNALAPPHDDEPIFAADRVDYSGQVIGLVIARDTRIARQAARLARLEYSVEDPVLDVWQAVDTQQFVLPSVCVQRGNATDAISRSALTLEGEFSVGGQDHFYLEGQVAYAMRTEPGQWLIQSSTQHPGEVQHWVAHALGVSLASVRVECRRMGGGFGGKETQAGQIAVWAALASFHCDRPVKIRLDRDDDMRITGKRHPFHYRYQVGFDPEGRIIGLDLTMAVDCGFSIDLSGPVADRAVFHADNAYFIENLRINSHRCRTNRQSNTAFRGFGGPQGMIAIETIIGDMARSLGSDPLDVRYLNLYGQEQRNVTHYGMQIEDNIAPELMRQLERESGYRERRQQIELHNRSSQHTVRGIAITPVKFGISFTATHLNQAGALVNVYQDGSVLVNHGGTEMGQGLHTKVLQVVASVFALPMDSVKISASDTDKIPNASATAASSGADLNAHAAMMAAISIRDRLVEFFAHQNSVPSDSIRFENAYVVSDVQPSATTSFKDLVRQAYAARIQLWSDGFYATPKISYDKALMKGRPFFYFAYGAACSEVEIDLYTGQLRLLAVDILHDAGTSLNPAIDRGQIEGGFVQGLGWLTTEELVWDGHGGLRTFSPSTYKIPSAGDVPGHFRVQFWNAPNKEETVYRSKAVGEPPFMLALSVWEAARDAIGAHTKAPVRVNGPLTPERVFFALGERSAPS